MSELAAASAGQDAISRLAKVEAELDALRNELDHTHQLATLGTLTAGIAHEINNILTPVLAYAQLAKGNPGDAELQEKALERAIAGVESASRIIEAVLGFARSDEDTGPANVVNVIDSTLACLGREPKRDGVTLRVDADPEARVLIPPVALQQVLLNLMLNAVSAMRGKRGDLRITVTPQEGGTTTIAVADTGPGIPEHLAGKLFDPFVTSRPKRDGSSVAGCHGGSGLGLAVCKRLIESAGGSIAVGPSDLPPKPDSGPGAKFTITLPTCLQAGQKAA
jgi:signal transduction histidine kinase